MILQVISNNSRVGIVGLGVSIEMYASPLVFMVSHLFLPLKFWVQFTRKETN